MFLSRTFAVVSGLARIAAASIVVLGAATLPCFGQTPPANLLNATYDPAIPTVQAVLGHASGAEITSPEQTLAWFRALAKAAPDRVVVTSYAKSWEGRELITAAISSQ